MKTLWTPPANYWAGAKGQCGSCGTQVELEKEDAVKPFAFGYKDFPNAVKQVFKRHYITFDATCPTCAKNIHVTKEID